MAKNRNKLVQKAERGGKTVATLMTVGGLATTLAACGPLGNNESEPRETATSGEAAPTVDNSYDMGDPEIKSNVRPELYPDSLYTVLENEGPEAYKKLLAIPASSLGSPKDYPQKFIISLNGAMSAGMSSEDFKNGTFIERPEKAINKYDRLSEDALGIKLGKGLRDNILNKFDFLGDGTKANGDSKFQRYRWILKLDESSVNIKTNSDGSFDAQFSAAKFDTIDPAYYTSLGTSPEIESYNGEVSDFTLENIRPDSEGNLKPAEGVTYGSDTLVRGHGGEEAVVTAVEETSSSSSTESTPTDTPSADGEVADESEWDNDEVVPADEQSTY